MLISTSSLKRMAWTLTLSLCVSGLIEKGALAACTPGQKMWVTACDHTSVVSQWDEGERNKDCTWNPPAGWTIINHRVQENSSNNGSQSVSILAGGSKFATSYDYSSASKAVNDILAQYTDSSGENKYKGTVTSQINSSAQYARQHSASHNTLRLEISARGSGAFYDQQRGWQDTSVFAQILCVGDPDPNKLQSSLIAAVGLPGAGALSRVIVSNRCSHPIELALSWLRPTGEWDTQGWWAFAPDASSSLTTSVNQRPVMTNGTRIYYYAKSTDNSNLEWKADPGSGKNINLAGKSYRMRLFQIQESSGNNPVTILFTCP